MLREFPSSSTDIARLQNQPGTHLLLDDHFIQYATDLAADARYSIWILAFTWRWYENTPERPIQKLNYNIARKVAAGLDVRAIVHSSAQAEILRSYGINTRTLPTARVMHTKGILVDSKALLIGSHNLTQRGTDENYEATIATVETSATGEFQTYFEQLWLNYAV